MPAVDPTYPLFPVACILSSALLLLTLATSFICQSWNLGVTFICCWLFWENLTFFINGIVWSDNYDVRLSIYCDIVSHLQMLATVVKPMCTLIIVRRLHLIASLRSVDLPSTREKRKNQIVEWTLGLIIPLIVAGPLYYAVQSYRFVVEEGFGCSNDIDDSILSQLLIDSWSVVPPLISVGFYYPKVVWVFYRQHQDTNRFLSSNNSISRTNYFRILTLASIDLLFTLPVGIINLIIENVVLGEFYEGHIPFYNGWDYVHSYWAPVGVSYTALKSEGAATLPLHYFACWRSPALAFIIFGLFGLTAAARATYWRALYFFGNYFGWTTTPQKTGEKHGLSTMEFGARPQEVSLDAEMGSRPSFVNFEPVLAISPTNADSAKAGARVSEDHNENDSSGSAVDAVRGEDWTTAAVSPREGRTA